MSPRKVLFIAWYFPPDGGAGTQRIAKFCKYLPQFGWQPFVLTRALDAGRSYWTPEDAGLLEDVESCAEIIRADELNELESVGSPTAVDRACAIVNRVQPDAVVITMSPFQLSQLGRGLQARCGVPIIYDLRDPWALDGVPHYGSRRRWRHQFDCMLTTLGNADGVIANTEASRAALLRVIPGLRNAQITAIPNGFDQDDFTSDAPEVEQPGHRPMKLLHTGNFLCDRLYRHRGLRGLVRRFRSYSPEPIDPSGRTPFHLLRALRVLREQRHEAGDGIRLVHVGRDDPYTRRCVDESGIADAVEFTGYLPHAESVARVRSADALFLHLHGLPPGHRSLIVPGKTYEYVASGRPILACLPPGDAREIVERTNRAYCADACDVAQICNALIRLYRDWSAGTLNSAGQPAWINTFDRRFLTGRLTEFLESVAAHAPAPAAGAGPSTGFRLTAMKQELAGA